MRRGRPRSQALNTGDTPPSAIQEDPRSPMCCPPSPPPARRWAHQRVGPDHAGTSGLAPRDRRRTGQNAVSSAPTRFSPRRTPESWQRPGTSDGQRNFRRSCSPRRRARCMLCESGAMHAPRPRAPTTACHPKCTPRDCRRNTMVSPSMTLACPRERPTSPRPPDVKSGQRNGTHSRRP